MFFKKWFIIFFFIFMIFHSQEVLFSSIEYPRFSNINFDDNIAVKSMGGVSASYVPNFDMDINFLNPASNIRFSKTLFNTNITLNNSKNIFFSKISLGVPIKNKYFIGLSCQPFKEINSKLYKKKFNTIKNCNKKKYLKYNNYVDLLNIFLTYKINNKISFGLLGNFLFGDVIQKNIFYSLPEFYKYNIFNKKNKTNKKLIFSTSFLYNIFIDSKNKINLGGVYKFHKKFHYKDKVEIFNFDYKKKTLNNYKKKIILNGFNEFFFLKNHPSSLTMGFSYYYKNLFMLGIQNEYILNNNKKDIFNSSKLDDILSSPKRICLGGYFIPNNLFLNKIVYRYGAYYEKNIINIENFFNYGLTFGFSIPLKRLKNNSSYLDLGFDLGNLILNKKHKKKYFNVKSGFIFGEKWFKSNNN